jgi:hypothetical protein
MRPSAVLALASAATVLAAALPPAVGAASHPIKNGYYASLGNVPSTLVAFHVHTGGKVPDLTLNCEPADKSLTDGTGAVGVLIHAPSSLKIEDGHITYSGAATITGGYGGAPKIGMTTLKLTARHVNGPVIHYVHEDRHLQETTAWKGTASSPVCKPLPRKGAFTLFGPVEGE